MGFKRGHRTIAVVLFRCFAFLFCTGVELAAFPGEPEGYGGVTWGTRIDALKPLRYAGTDGSGVALYERPGEELIYGRAKLIAIEYGFENGRLTTVTLKVDSLPQYLLMKEEAFKRYEEGKQLAGHEDSYSWSGEIAEVLLMDKFVVS